MTLEAFKQLESQATPGPWIWANDGPSDWSVGQASGAQGKRVCELHRRHAVECPDAAFIAAMRTMAPKLIAVAEAARSVLSEEGVREYLSAYVMGVELIERLSALEE